MRWEGYSSYWLCTIASKVLHKDWFLLRSCFNQTRKLQGERILWVERQGFISFDKVYSYGFPSPIPSINNTSNASISKASLSWVSWSYPCACRVPCSSRWA